MDTSPSARFPAGCHCFHRPEAPPPFIHALRDGRRDTFFVGLRFLFDPSVGIKEDYLTDLVHWGGGNVGYCGGPLGNFLVVAEDLQSPSQSYGHKPRYVTPEFIERTCRLRQLRDPTAFSPMEHALFSGMSFIFLDDKSLSDRMDDVEHYAGEVVYWDSDYEDIPAGVTHIVLEPETMKTDPALYAKALEYREGVDWMTVLILHSSWFDAVQAARSIVPVEDYLLPPTYEEWVEVEPTKKYRSLRSPRVANASR